MSFDYWKAFGTTDITPTVTPTGTPIVTPTVTPTPGPIEGTLRNGWYYFKGVGSKKYLQVQDNLRANGQNIQTYEANGATAQQYKLIPTSRQNTFGIVSRCSSDTKGLGVVGKSTDHGANVQKLSVFLEKHIRSRIQHGRHI